MKSHTTSKANGNSAVRRAVTRSHAGTAICAYPWHVDTDAIPMVFVNGHDLTAKRQRDSVSP